MRAFLAGVVAGLVASALGAGVLLGTGRFEVAADAPAGWVERIAPRVRDRSIARRSPALRRPLPFDRDAAARGLSHYAENCLPCHGAPGVPPAEFQQGMNPPPPSIESPMVQGYSDAELVWIVTHGIRMTGMPGFGVHHDEAEIRDIVAFVRRLPRLDEAERTKLRSRAPAAARPQDHDHHHD